MQILPTLIMLAIFFAIDIYAFQAIKTIAQSWNPTVSTIVKLGYWAFSIYIVFVFLGSAILGREFLPRTAAFITLFSLVSLLIGKLIVIGWLFSEDLFRGFCFVSNRIMNNNDTVDMDGRRKFISQAAILTAAIPFATLIYGVVRNAYRYQFTNVQVKLKNLPKAFEGFRIVQLSDIHSGSFNEKQPIEDVVEKINALEADLIVFTGDLVNDLATEMDDYKEIFAKLKAKNGVMSITGNHDYGMYHYGREDSEEKTKNFNDFQQVHADMGWDLLMDENRVIQKEGEELAIIGVQNWGASEHFPRVGDLSKAIKGVENHPAKILLSHDPSHWQAQVVPEFSAIDLQLSGHTHGFQFGIETKWFKWSPVQYVYKQWAGLYEDKGQQLYVNRGFGFIGYPGRIGILPEVTILELQQG